MVMMPSISTLDALHLEFRRDHLGHVSWRNLNLSNNVWKQCPRQLKSLAQSNADWESTNSILMNFVEILYHWYPTKVKDQLLTLSYMPGRRFWRGLILLKTDRCLLLCTIESTD